MHPLVSPATECRWFGVSFIVGSLFLFGVGLVFDGLFRAVFVFVWSAAFFGVAMYLVQYRSIVRRASEAAAAPPSELREPREATLGRVAMATVVQVIVLGGLSVIWYFIPYFNAAPEWSLAAGILAGLGLMNLPASRWLKGWESDHDTDLLKVGLTARQILRLEDTRDAWRVATRNGLIFYGMPRDTHEVVNSSV